MIVAKIGIRVASFTAKILDRDDPTSPLEKKSRKNLNRLKNVKM